MAPSALWIYAHRALSPQFHDDPAKFVAALDGAGAPAYLEKMWAWAISKGPGPNEPPLVYGIDRPREGKTVVWMEFSTVAKTGEPWQMRFVITDDVARVFLLEHSEYATELDGKPTAIVCESEKGGRHVNWQLTMAPDDAGSFDAFVLAQVSPS